MTKITKCECGSTEFTQVTNQYCKLEVVNGKIEEYGVELPECNDAPIICNECNKVYKEDDFNY